jgi:Phage capsid family.
MKRKTYIGFKLFVAALIVFASIIASKAMAFTLLVLAGFWLMLPVGAFFNMRSLRGKFYEGDPGADEDEAKKVLEAVRKQTEKILQQRGFVNKDALNAELETRMAKLKDFSTEDMALLKVWLTDGDKGIRSILQKQGEELASLKELGGKGKKEVDAVRAWLNDQKNQDKIERIFNTGEGEIKLDVRAAATMTLDNTITGHAALPDELIESFSIGAFVPKRQAREYVFDLAYRRTVAKITQFKTWLEEGSEEGGFAVVAEGGLKPLVSTSLVRNHSEYKKVAAKQVITEEFAKFRSEAYTIIQRLVSQKLVRDYANILTTNLLADAAPYVASALDGQYANPTDYHAIGAVAAQIEAINFMPDMLVMNPQDKWRIGLSQDAQGQFYLTIPMTDPSGQTRMMGFTLRTSTKVPVGDFILGEAGLWEIEDEPITIRMGMGITVTPGVVGVSVTQVESDLDHNRFRIIAETFFHNYIATNNQGSFVKATFDTVKAALQSV